MESASSVYRGSSPFEVFKNSWEKNIEINDTMKNVYLLSNAFQNSSLLSKKDLKKFISINFLTSFNIINNTVVKKRIVSAWGGPNGEGAQFLKSLYKTLDIAKTHWSDLILSPCELTIFLLKNKDIEDENLHRLLIDQSIVFDGAVEDIVRERGINFLCDFMKNKWKRNSIQSFKLNDEDQAEAQYVIKCLKIDM